MTIQQTFQQWSDAMAKLADPGSGDADVEHAINIASEFDNADVQNNGDAICLLSVALHYAEVEHYPEELPIAWQLVQRALTGLQLQHG